jgi:hypothetical protein
VSNRFCGLAFTGGAFLPAALLVFLASANGQAPAANAAAWTPARTPEGHPDMQGIYFRRGVGTREAKPPTSSLDDSFFLETGFYPKLFSGASGKSAQPKQTPPTGIVDPPDKNLPWRPEADAKRREFLMHLIPPASLAHVEAIARCMPLGPIWNDDRNAFQILQRNGSFVLQNEFNHMTRIIYTDGRPHIGSGIKLFMGDSIGHWEGDTLVVDTTNYTDKTGFSRDIPYNSDALHTIERFTMADPDMVLYEITIDDPQMWTKSWKVAGYFARAEKGYELIEYGCAEGTQTLKNIFGY